MTTFSPVTPDSITTFEVDFTSYAVDVDGNPDLIVNAVVDPTPNDLLIINPIVTNDGTAVLWSVTGGSGGTNYLLSFTLTKASGNIDADRTTTLTVSNSVALST